MFFYFLKQNNIQLLNLTNLKFSHLLDNIFFLVFKSLLSFFPINSFFKRKYLGGKIKSKVLPQFFTSRYVDKI